MKMRSSPPYRIRQCSSSLDSNRPCPRYDPDVLPDTRVLGLAERFCSMRKGRGRSHMCRQQPFQLRSSKKHRIGKTYLCPASPSPSNARHHSQPRAPTPHDPGVSHVDVGTSLLVTYMLPPSNSPAAWQNAYQETPLPNVYFPLPPNSLLLFPRLQLVSLDLKE
ncbi:hypothetical protein BDQ17DRAFT_1422295 [Cyathus striatus]|nr:hypothetical protein BDQ17DRAFT_1422295 [Cyathus striatus]